MIAKQVQHRRGASKKRATRFDVVAGRHIRAHRLDAGLSQTALADAIGVTFQQVQKYEKGSNRVSLERFARIADVFSRAGCTSASELVADIMRDAGVT